MVEIDAGGFCNVDKLRQRETRRELQWLRGRSVGCAGATWADAEMRQAADIGKSTAEVLLQPQSAPCWIRSMMGNARSELLGRIGVSRLVFGRRQTHLFKDGAQVGLHFLVLQVFGEFALGILGVDPHSYIRC